MLIHIMETQHETKQHPLTIGQRNVNRGKERTKLRLGLIQIPVAIDGTNLGNIFRMCALVNMVNYAIEMTKFEVSGNLVALQPGCS